MNFTQAVKAMLEGKKVKLAGSTEILLMEEGDNSHIVNEELEIVDLDGLIDGQFVEVTDLEANDIYAVFSAEKNRWVSTTDPNKHKTAGKKVAVFSLNREL